MGKNRKPINLNRFQIFDYWKDYCIDKHGILHKEGDCPIEDSIPVVTDWEEQSCWGCGERIPSKDGRYSTWVRKEDYWAIWNDGSPKITLERAHIIPDALGGLPRRDNLFLLCPVCHRESPDTLSKQMFFKWIYNTRSVGNAKKQCFRKALDILKSDYGISYPFFDTWDEIVKVGNNIGSHTNFVVNSSYIYSIVCNALKNKSRLDGKAEFMFENELRGKIAELIRNDPHDERIKIYREVLSWYRQAKDFESKEELRL